MWNGLGSLNQVDLCSWNQAYWWGNPIGPFGSVCVPSGPAYNWLRCSYGYGSPYGPAYYGYAPGYPYGYGLAAETWYVGQNPIVIINGSGGTSGPATPTHGRVVNGRGYTQGGNAEPSGTAQSSTAPAPSAPAAPASSGSSDGGGTSAPAPASSAGGERTAHPR